MLKHDRSELDYLSLVKKARRHRAHDRPACTIDEVRGMNDTEPTRIVRFRCYRRTALKEAATVLTVAASSW